MNRKKKDFPKLDLTSEKQGFGILLIGIIVALVLGSLSWRIAEVNWILLAVGVVVGILNIFHKEGTLFLISGLTLTFILNLLAGLAFLPLWLAILFNAIVYVLAPATLIVGLKVLYALATK